MVVRAAGSLGSDVGVSLRACGDPWRWVYRRDGLVVEAATNLFLGLACPLLDAADHLIELAFGNIDIIVGQVAPVTSQ